MTTVTYKHQPAIHASRGAVPLAGTSHLYTVSKVLWPDSVETFLEGLLIPTSLHVCSGASRLGDVRLDRDPTHAPDIVADAAAIPLPDDAVASVLCDPPHNGVFQWNHDLLAELARVARERIIFQHWFIPATAHGLYKKAQDTFALTAVYVWQPRTYFGRVQVVSVLDRRRP